MEDFGLAPFMETSKDWQVLVEWLFNLNVGSALTLAPPIFYINFENILYWDKRSLKYNITALFLQNLIVWLSLVV